ncbi:TPA: hypothetical protein ACH3X1_014701 [Trebouxia sp. C0004]
MESHAPEVESQRSDEIDLTDQGSQSVGSKRKAGRPVTSAWDTFKKVFNPNPGKTKRNWVGVCQFGRKNLCETLKHFCNRRRILQKAEELANADAVAAEAQQKLSRMRVFNEYYEGDVQDMSKSSINNIVDVKAAEFDLDFSGKVDQVELPDMDFGTSDASEWNVDKLLQVT